MATSARAQGGGEKRRTEREKNSGILHAGQWPNNFKFLSHRSSYLFTDRILPETRILGTRRCNFFSCSVNNENVVAVLKTSSKFWRQKICLFLIMLKHRISSDFFGSRRRTEASCEISVNVTDKANIFYESQRIWQRFAVKSFHVWWELWAGEQFVRECEI